jgi:hypothetical protein
MFFIKCKVASVQIMHYVLEHIVGNVIDDDNLITLTLFHAGTEHGFILFT